MGAPPYWYFYTSSLNLVVKILLGCATMTGSLLSGEKIFNCHHRDFRSAVSDLTILKTLSSSIFPNHTLPSVGMVKSGTQIKSLSLSYHFIGFDLMWLLFTRLNPHPQPFPKYAQDKERRELGAVLALVKVVIFGVIVQFSRFSLGDCRNLCVIFPHSGHSNVWLAFCQTTEITQQVHF
jgi:hypothetical protein